MTHVQIPFIFLNMFVEVFVAMEMCTFKHVERARGGGGGGGGGEFYINWAHFFAQ